MTKKEIVWLLIRLAGFYFIWRGVEGLIGLLSSFVTAMMEPALFSKSGGIFLQSFLMTGFYLWIGFYLMGDCRFIFRLLNSQPDYDS
jgi:hypothetical protein